MIGSKVLLIEDTPELVSVILRGLAEEGGLINPFFISSEPGTVTLETNRPFLLNGKINKELPVVIVFIKSILFINKKLFWFHN